MQRLANNFGAFTNMVPPLLNMVDFAHRLVGPKPLEFLSKTLNKGTGNIVPTWNPYLPRVRASLATMLCTVLTLDLAVQPASETGFGNGHTVLWGSRQQVKGDTTATL